MIDDIFCSLVSNDLVMKICVLQSVISVFFISSVPFFSHNCWRYIGVTVWFKFNWISFHSLMLPVWCNICSKVETEVELLKSQNRMLESNRVPSPTQRPCCIMHHALHSQDSKFESGFYNWLLAPWLQNREFPSKLCFFSELWQQSGND